MWVSMQTVMVGSVGHEATRPGVGPASLLGACQAASHPKALRWNGVRRRLKACYNSGLSPIAQSVERRTVNP
ncbi:hypothetical protein SRAA_1865 [Serpentinimonas raichei]|uniref:Uncharacterized protein n=1 Tax=Serpentinimonas raichei TaxID=1458425 RepID=A0A060NS30_9BURK|nr:hypothetical protein SRAA_1865 [Serpentinimonas raichei]